ncbi:MAG: hypothetical protein CBC35_00535 [Planctomycetes bacterium TMED75]|nr:hypothetical protein [Planctomycetaceae bacterium]OUU96828.1 MAG: hypothetical protein CBC35_00535 [Planctomycetes bacterium TMED75]
MRCRTPFILLAALLGVGCTSAPSSSPKQPIVPFEFVELIMASPARLKICTQEEAQARRAARAAFDRMHQIERILSSWMTNSQSNRLVRAAPEFIVIPEELRIALERGQQIHRESEGAFDLTAGPCIELWRETRSTGRLPEEHQRVAAHARLGMESIQLKGPLARINRRGVSLNFGGIGKGIAVEAARVVLEQHGINRFLIDFDGEIRAQRPPPDRPWWVIEVQSLGDEPSWLIKTTMMSVSTSGDLHQFVEIDGTRYSHVIDPRTGLGVTTGRQVTVFSTEGSDVADALATTGCVLDPAPFQKLLEEHHPQSSAIVLERIDQETTITMIGAPPVSIPEAP